MLKIYNGTPHAINVVTGATYNPAIRKYTGGEVVLSLGSDGVLNAKIPTVELGPVGNIPLFGKQIEGFDPIPSGFDVVIVSALYAAAVEGERGSECIYTVADPVMSEDGNTFVGCRGICKPMQSPALVKANMELANIQNNIGAGGSGDADYWRKEYFNAL